MDFNIDVRKKQLQSLDQYITSSKDKVQSVLDFLGWNAKTVMEKERETRCSMNPAHVIALKSTDEHLKNCSVKTLGYQIDDEYLSEPMNGLSTSIKLDNEMKIAVLSSARENNQKFKAAWNGQDPDPMTSDRMFTTFSSDERLALYDYCVQNTEHPPVPSEFNIKIEDKKEEKFLTSKEILEKERDAKRRRVKYKSVHTSRNKNHTEIIREVIDNQMEQYRDYIASKIEISTGETSTNQNNEQNLMNTCADIDIMKEIDTEIERPNSSISRHSNHSSSSRNKKDYNKHEKSYTSYNHDTDNKRDYKEYERRHYYSEKNNYSVQRERRKYDFEEDYKHSRERRERYYKSERRH